MTKADIVNMLSVLPDEAEIKAIIPPVIGIVEGNNDADLYPVRNVLSDEPYYVQWKVPIFNVLEACGQRIFFTHGHRNYLYLGTGEIISAAKKSNCKIALYGHTHIAAEKLGFCRHSLTRCARGERKSAYGYIWEYKEGV